MRFARRELCACSFVIVPVPSSLQVRGPAQNRFPTRDWRDDTAIRAGALWRASLHLRRVDGFRRKTCGGARPCASAQWAHGVEGDRLPRSWIKDCHETCPVRPFRGETPQSPGGSLLIQVAVNEPFSEPEAAEAIPSALPASGQEIQPPTLWTGKPLGADGRNMARSDGTSERLGGGVACRPDAARRSRSRTRRAGLRSSHPAASGSA